MATVHQLAGCVGVDLRSVAGAGPARPPAAMQEIEAVEKDLEVLAVTVAELVNRIAPVLTPAPPDVYGETECSRSIGPMSPFCERLAYLRWRVMSIRSQVADAASRLAL